MRVRLSWCGTSFPSTDTGGTLIGGRSSSDLHTCHRCREMLDDLRATVSKTFMPQVRGCRGDSWCCRFHSKKKHPSNWCWEARDCTRVPTGDGGTQQSRGPCSSKLELHDLYPILHPSYASSRRMQHSSEISE